MNTDYPHEIQHFSNGEPIPETYIPLTTEQVAELELMDADARALWLKAHRKDDPTRSFKDELMHALEGGDKAERRAMRRDERAAAAVPNPSQGPNRHARRAAERNYRRQQR